jgi:hypothetical protein
VVNWVSNLVVTFTFLDIVHAIGAAGIFFIYVGVCALSWVFSFWIVPETKGRSLEDIEQNLRGTPAPASQALRHGSAA